MNSIGLRMTKRARPMKKPEIPAIEKKQMRAMKLVGGEAMLTKDEYGRDRMAATAVAQREFDIGSMRAVVSVRDVDPLKGISSLTWQQRKAGQRYREDFEICQREGVKPVSWEIRVDGSGAGKTMPERIADAHAAIIAANTKLGYNEIRRTVEMVCGHCMSISEVARAGLAQALSGATPSDMIVANSPMRREVVVYLLGLGLQNLAVHYGIVSEAKR